MSDRLTPEDVAFFHHEGRSTPQHVGGLTVFTPPEDGLDYDRLVRLVQERIPLVPRYRQKVRFVPARLANPVWVDDASFDITYHVRRSALPRPGTEAQLLDFCARIQSRMLDRSRPLWEVYLVEGLADGQLAIVTKTHPSMVDRLGAVDIAQVMLDSSPAPLRTVEPAWMPEPEPSATGLVLDAVAGVARRPAAAIDAVRSGAKDVRASTKQLTAKVGGAASSVLALVRTPPTSPLRVTVGRQRRVAVARTRLDDYRLVRRAHGGTVHDVALATVAGGLRAWLSQRGELLSKTLTVRALVPVSVCDGGAAERDADEPGVGGPGVGGPGADRTGADAGTDAGCGCSDPRAHRVAPLLVELPVGEPNALRRMARIRTAMAEQTGSDRSVSADALVALDGFAPPTLHALGARAANGLTRRTFDLVVSNVPGPQRPLYAAGARMTEMFPILPVGPGQALSIGVTSYDGGVFFGINADRDAVSDVHALATLLEEALGQLVDASPAAERGPARARGARGAAGRGTGGHWLAASRRAAGRAPGGSGS